MSLLGRFFAVLLVWWDASCWADVSSINAGRPYTVDPPPNYRAGANPSAPVLTDGREVGQLGRFWTQSATAGWESVRQIKASFDLGAAHELDTLALTVASGTAAGVHFPVASYVFLSEDQETWTLGGCSRHVSPRAGVGSDGEIRERLEIPLGNQRARFVQFFVVPSGEFFFTDEVSILPAKPGAPRALRPVQVSRQGLTKVVDSMRHRDWSRYLAASRDPVRARSPFADCSLDEVGAPRAFAADEKARSRAAPKQLESFTVFPCVDDERISVGTGCSGGPGLLRKQEWFRLGARQYRAFRVNANSGGVLPVSVRSQHGKVRAAVFESPFVQALNGELLADPLRVGDGSISVDASLGGVVVLELDAVQSGRDRIEVQFGKGSQAWRHDFDVDVVPLAEPSRLFGNVWPYLDWPLVADRQEAAVQDLKRHGADVLVVPYRILPVPGKGGDFSGLAQLAAKFDKPRAVLLYLGVDQRGPEPGNPWFDKGLLGQWLAGAYAALERAGVAREQVYLYPVDEPRGSSLGIAQRFVPFLRANHPGARLYSTLSVRDALVLLPQLDVAQVLDRKGLAEAAAKQIKPGQQLWLYMTDGPSKLNDPYAYYRLMGWRAFALGAEGVGFWNYADTQRGAYAGDGWDDIDSGRDFAVVYRGAAGSIVDGRRWEAFSSGLDDFQVLKAYQRFAGVEAARRMAVEVVEGKTPGQAENARQRILRELSAGAILVK